MEYTVSGEIRLSVLRAKVPGGYGMCEVCELPNTATYALFNPDYVGYRAYCATHVAVGIDYLARVVSPA